MGSSTFKPIIDEKAPYRIISMDGGGIYGLSTAVMLRRLCEKNKKFLTKEEPITLFGGTSAGAIITLLLARAEEPREVVMRGDLENFFKDSRVYSNSADPVQSILSLFFITTWSGEKDFRDILYEYFGDMTMGDLKQRVLITSFDFTGETKIGKKEEPRWKTKIFYNFPNYEKDRNLKVVDVAYGAASPAGLRTIRNGISDGGIFSPNPAVNTIAKVIANTDYSDLITNVFETILLPINEIHMERLKIILGKEEVELPIIPKKLIRKVDHKCWEIENLTLDPSTKKLYKQFKHEFQEFKKIFEEENQYFADKTADYFYSNEKRKEAFEKIVKSYAVELEFVQNTLMPAGTTDKVVREKNIKNLLKQLWLAKTMVECYLDYQIEHENMPPEHEEEGDHVRMEQYFQRIKDAALELEDEEHLEKAGLPYSFIRSAYEEQRDLYKNLVPAPIKNLKQLALLSLGVCSDIPSYFTGDINLSSLFFNLIPTNVLTNNFFPPTMKLLLDAPSDVSTYEARQLLGEDSFRRLSPPAIDFPTPPIMPSVYLARFPVLKEWLANSIYQCMEKDVVEEAVEDAAQWMRDREKGWQNSFDRS